MNPIQIVVDGFLRQFVANDITPPPTIVKLVLNLRNEPNYAQTFRKFMINELPCDDLILFSNEKSPKDFYHKQIKYQSQKQLDALAHASNWFWRNQDPDKRYLTYSEFQKQIKNYSNKGKPTVEFPSVYSLICDSVINTEQHHDFHGCIFSNTIFKSEKLNLSCCVLYNCKSEQKITCTGEYSILINCDLDNELRNSFTTFTS